MCNAYIEVLFVVLYILILNMHEYIEYDMEKNSYKLSAMLKKRHELAVEDKTITVNMN